jgi:maltose alpha-D-glucosyltransferase/alpha-amylase
VQVELEFGPPERYVVPLAFLEGAPAEEIRKWHAEGVVADLRAGAVEGVLVDAVHSPSFVGAMADTLARRRTLHGRQGQISGVPTQSLRQFNGCLRADCPTTPLAAEQSNSSVLMGDQAIMKFVRRFEEGVNPGVELGRHLSERARFAHAPRLGGSLEYRSRSAGSTPGIVAVLEEFVPNESDGWRHVVDALTIGLEEAVTGGADAEPQMPGGLEPPEDGEAVHPLVGPHLEWATLLGERTAELHVALATDRDDPHFTPEPLTALDRQALFHGARSLTRQVLRDVVAKETTSPLVEEILRREGEIVGRLRRLSATPVDAYRIRCHGDYHLGQVLWTGKDFYLIDFEGEPTRSLGWRRLKRPATVDLAGMIRSLHYAGQAAALRVNLEFGSSIGPDWRERFDGWIAHWHHCVSTRFLDAYLEVARRSPWLPSRRADVTTLLDFFRLEKAMYELSYELNSRPTWVDIPARGILDILDSEQ